MQGTFVSDSEHGF